MFAGSALAAVKDATVAGELALCHTDPGLEAGRT